MNRYFKEFLHRGLMFGGFGPIVMDIVFAVSENTMQDFSVTGGQILLAVVSVYLLAFVHAGASVFNQIEGWPIAKSLFFHFGFLYFSYLLCYLLNTWIPFEPMVVAVFSVIFVAAYFAIWLSVYLIVRSTEKKLNARLPK